MSRIFRITLFVLIISLVLGYAFFKPSSSALIPTAIAKRESLKVEIKTVGELEAARSLAISSSIKGDQGKIIDLIPDGIYVDPGQVLVKMDPTPFEEKVVKLKGKLKEQKAYIKSLKQSLEWEMTQAEHKNRMAAYEVETAQLELDKMRHGDGPQEISRLKGAMQKARMKYEELNAYSNDLLELEKEGFLNSIEVKQAQKKLEEEREAYEMAKLQYDTYVEHVYPMQIKKVETTLKRAQVSEEETAKAGAYNIAKALSLLEEAKHGMQDYFLELQEGKKELALSEIKAPAPGMVVLREDYRSGQRRKPRVGDILVKNQPLLDLPDLSSMIVKTRVREGDLFKISIGKKATIEIDAYPELIFKGTISSIGVLAVGDQGSANEDKYFDVRIALDESDPRLRPGMTTRATIHAQEAQDILIIPLHAVFAENKRYYCYVRCFGNRYKKEEIKLGISNEQWVEVKEGLQEGASVSLLNPNI